ncbi:UNVERIFIED_CONTAM: hypothetical protein PYX00_005734 [Menopon gallinae]|uniref:SEC14-like protein 1 n=2 Tax=Menopon gallinae TaxID=328185 RepID=A0AAW2HUB1_9NEOP
MVQKYQSPVRIYKYPFELVMMAYERRFPSCPQIPIVLDCEVISDVESPDGSVRNTERRCKLGVEAPYLLKKIIGVDVVYFIQKNCLDRRKRVLDIEAFNESFSTRVTVLEHCRYFVHPENSDWTCFEQSATLDIRNFLGFENSMEKLAMKQYSANIAKGKEIVEYFVNQLREEGITHVPVWSPSHVSKDQNEDNYAAEEFKSEEMKAKGDHFQLETDYIRRYLGELTLIQESNLVQLKKWVAALQKGKVPNDSTLLRFLRARDFNVEKAREMLSQSLIWRKKHAVDRILSEYAPPQVVKDYFPGGWHHEDKDGRPLYILRLGQMDVKGLLKSIGEEGLLKLTLAVCEEGLKLMEDATRRLGRPISTWTLLVDLEGLNMRHLWRPGIRALLRIIEIVEANYPETMGRVLIIRAPRVFPILWTIVGTFIDENTRTKFLFYGGNDYMSSGGLIDYISSDILPDFLGGPSKTSVSEGGLVPKNLYLTTGDIDREGFSLKEDSLYHSISLGKGQIHEVVIHIDEPHTVITWDFDVMLQDVVFSVLVTSLPLSTKETSCIGDSEHKCVIDKNWKEGKEYFKVETPIVCHDGESVQGSHVAKKAGSYVLQWKFHSGHQLDLLDSLTQHKAQVIYFYETLSSAEYRGSMSSLQSGHSAFSSLSNRSGASSCPSR